MQQQLLVVLLLLLLLLLCALGYREHSDLHKGLLPKLLLLVVVLLLLERAFPLAESMRCTLTT